MRLSISVIIPVFNGERYLKEALQSIFAQKRQPDQIILVDDGSTDGTARIARAYPEITYVYQENRGVAFACNLGIRSAAGDLIAFLDTDDIWAAYILERHCALLEQNPESQISLGLVQPFRMKRAGVETPEMEYIGAPACLLNLGSALFRKEVFARIGLLDEHLAIVADWDWFLRAREEMISILTYPETVLYYRRHGANLTNRQKQLDHDLLVMFKKALDRRRRLYGVARELPGLSEYLAQVKRYTSFHHNADE